MKYQSSSTWKDPYDWTKARNYRRYLLSQEWKDRRAEFLSEKSRCHKCGIIVGLGAVLHHISYHRVGWERKKDLVVMCKGCHHSLHALQKRNKWGTLYATAIFMNWPPRQTYIRIFGKRKGGQKYRNYLKNLRRRDKKKSTPKPPPTTPKPEKGIIHREVDLTPRKCTSVPKSLARETQEES